MSLIKKLDNLRRHYPMYSQEGDIVSTIRVWVKDASKSMIPESPLQLAEAHLEGYETKLKAKGNSCIYLIDRLRGIIDEAYVKFVDNNIKEAAR